MIRHRTICSCFLLVVAILLTSGVMSACAEMFRTITVETCCSHSQDSELPPVGAPCSESECQCVSCHSFVVPSLPATILHTADHSAAVSRLQDKLPPPVYFSSIDYPPEHS